MGNSSSTASSSTTTTNGEQYDVFLSFRGEDTRYGFTGYLYHALDEKQIKTFRDDKLVRGEEISEGLLSAIGESKISVIVFSEKYTCSKWCLLELAEIMKYREKKKQIVIPVFYKVEPSDVRKSYEAAFAMHENEWRHFQEEKKIEWRPALTEASGISGFVVTKGRDKSELVCNIVRDVWNKLYNISPLCDFKDLVGIEKHIAGVVSKLCLEVQDFRIIGIWGMGGMGKTTIARAVFRIISDQFENRTYFTVSVRAESENGLIRLRNEILSEVLNIENKKSSNRSIPQRIEEMLLQKKVLIVFDDVDSIEQLETLAGDLDRLGPGSRIIVTTRNKQVLRNCGVEDHNMYEVKGLNQDEALQLFRNYAFKQNHPTKDFEVLSREVVKIATNVPLAVKVLGSLLYSKGKRDWENAKDKFQRNVHHGVLEVLKISYDGLDEEEKGLFLDIACFRAFQMVDDFEPNLLSGRELSLSVLIDKSLVIVENGWIRMHDLLRDMGREIASKDHSRVWSPEDVIRTLNHNDGTDAVQGIFLSTSNLKDVYLSFQALTKMCNLTTLIINDGEVHVLGGLDYLPGKLRYLHWFEYPFEVLPSSFNPVNLVELDLSGSKIKQLWERSTCVPELKRLELVNCKDLISIPDLSNIPSVEIINLQDCSSLIEIHSSTECRELKWLNLDSCNNLISIPDLSNIPLAEIINLKDCERLTRIHSSRECTKNLHSLQLEGCSDLSSFPSKIHLSEEHSFSKSVVLHSSREGLEFSLRGCISLTKFPDISGNIKRLDLSFSGVEEVPSMIQSLSKLERLDMVKCKRLKRISKRICKLKSLDRLNLSRCFELESFPDILEEMELKYLNLSGTAIKELPPSIGNLNRLKELDLSDCENLETFPSSDSNLNLYGCSKLEKLSLYNCRMLRSLPKLPSSLRYLDARNCKQKIGRNCKSTIFGRKLPSLRFGRNCKESKFELCPDDSRSLYFNFLNCRKLDQKAVSNLLIFFRDSLRKMQGMGTEKIISLFKVSHEVNSHLPPNRRLLQTGPEVSHEVKGSICLPGSEIPEWFCLKNNGSSINIPGLRNDCDRSTYIMGFEICLVIGTEGYNDDLKNVRSSNIDVDYDFHIETSVGYKELFFSNSIELSGSPDGGSDHILLGYNLSRKCYKFFQELDTRLANRGMSDYASTSFEFNIRFNGPFRHFSFFRPPSKVKHCGIKPIYVKAQVNAEETCEPHPKRIYT